MKRKIVSVLLCILLLASLLPVSAFADTAVTEQTADIVSTNNSQEVWIYINNVTWPKLGQKLDQDIKESEGLKEAIDAGTDASVVVTGVVYPGTKIVISGASLMIKEAYKYCRYKKVRGDVKAQAL